MCGYHFCWVEILARFQGYVAIHPPGTSTCCLSNDNSNINNTGVPKDLVHYQQLVFWLKSMQSLCMPHSVMKKEKKTFATVDTHSLPTQAPHLCPTLFFSCVAGRTSADLKCCPNLKACKQVCILCFQYDRAYQDLKRFSKNGDNFCKQLMSILQQRYVCVPST